MKRRYAVFAEKWSSPHESALAPTDEFFHRVRSLPIKDSVQRGEIEVGGRRLRLSAARPLGGDTDLLVTELDDKERRDLNTMFPMLNIDEDVDGQMALFAPRLLEDAMATAGAPKKRVTVIVEDEHGKCLPGLRVEIIFEVTPDGRIGAEAITNSKGRAELVVAGSRKTALFVTTEPPHTYWPATIAKPRLEGAAVLRLCCESIASHPKDGIDRLYSARPPDGDGIRVAIIDGGVGPHNQLKLAAAGQTFVKSKGVGDNGIGHGTHVAGIVRRLAPSAQLLSYRVFLDGTTSTHGAIVAAAVEQALRDRVDIINLSITFEKDSPILRDRLKLAQQQGVICVCAAGNNAGPVMVPASYASAIAVAACGRRDWPKDALDRELKQPAGTKQKLLYAAAFTCFGPEVTFTAPGVGIVSTYPKNRLAVMNGTSMAAPVVTGLVAKLLSQDGHRSLAGVARAAGVTRALLRSARLLGVRSEYEGHGVPLPK